MSSSLCLVGFNFHLGSFGSFCHVVCLNVVCPFVWLIPRTSWHDFCLSVFLEAFIALSFWCLDTVGWWVVFALQCSWRGLYLCTFGWLSILPTPFGVLMVDLSFGIVCETCLASCLIFAFAWGWWFDIASFGHLLEAWKILPLSYSTLVTLSLDELSLFVFKLLPSLAHVLTSSCGELTWVRLLSSFALPWHRLLASLLEFDFSQALFCLDIVFWQAYLSLTFALHWSVVFLSSSF